MNLFIIVWTWIRRMVVGFVKSLCCGMGQRQNQKLCLRPWRRQLATSHRRFHALPKPKWVKREVIALKALMPQAGCRTIAHHFNRRHAARRAMTVSKTYVADTCRKQQYRILEVRRKLKHRVPQPMPRNRVWGCDLLVKTDRDGRAHLALAILDHASRACLRLQRLADKSSLTLFHELIDAVKQYGRPQFLRTDNEAVLVSRLFRLGLWLLGIRQQRIEPGWPRSLSGMTFVTRRRRCGQM